MISKTSVSSFDDRRSNQMLLYTSRESLAMRRIKSPRSYGKKFLAVHNDIDLVDSVDNIETVLQFSSSPC